MLRTLCSVLGAALLTVCNTLGIKRTTNNVITYTGQVTNTSTTDKNNRVLLKVVTDTGNVRSSLHSVGKSYSGDLTKCRVRLLRCYGSNLGANASSLRCSLVDGRILQSVEASLKRRSLRLGDLVLTTFPYELVKGWHNFPPSLKYSVLLHTQSIYVKNYFAMYVTPPNRHSSPIRTDAILFYHLLFRLSIVFLKIFSFFYLFLF